MAILLASIVMAVSFFSYAAAFVDTDTFDLAKAGVGLAIVPFVFVILAFVSGSLDAPRGVIRGMGLFLVVALGLGLIDPSLGFATGFAAGGSFALRRPDVENCLKWRIGASVFLAFYLLVLLVVVSPAGVFTAGLLPLAMIGFADEYSIWLERSR